MVPLSLQILHVEQTTSTNDDLLRLAEEEEVEHGTILRADHQTAGRGQHTRSWSSGMGQGLYCSIYLCIEQPPAYAFGLNAMVSLVAVDTLQAFTPHQCMIKYPNDIICNDKKIGGILIENRVTSRSFESVVGIGLNVAQDFSETPLAPKATSLHMLSTTHKKVSVDDVFQNLCTQLVQSRLLDSQSLSMAIQSGELWQRYHQSLAYRDSDVEVNDGGRTLIATLRGVTPEGKVLLHHNGEDIAYVYEQIKIRYPSNSHL